MNFSDPAGEVQKYDEFRDALRNAVTGRQSRRRRGKTRQLMRQTHEGTSPHLHAASVDPPESDTEESGNASPR